MLRILFIGLGLALATALLGTSLADRFGAEQPVTESRVATVPAPASSPRLVALQADRRGHFITDIQINNQFIRALVDTGASLVAMSSEDARKAGLKPMPGDFSIPVNTANGVVRAAKARVPSLKLQSIEVRDVEVMVMPPGALNHTLLGMSFLRRLASFEMNGNTLVLKR